MGFKIYKKGELDIIHYNFQDPEINISDKEKEKRQEFVDQSKCIIPINIDDRAAFKRDTIAAFDFKKDTNIDAIISEQKNSLKAIILNDENSAFYMASIGLYVLLINLSDNSVSFLTEKEKKTFKNKECMLKWGINTMVDIVLTIDMANVSDLYFFLKQGGLWIAKDGQSSNSLLEKQSNNYEYAVFKKPMANFYRQSVNFDIYKRKVESTHTFERVNRSYSDLAIFNEIAEKNNIKYVAVSGTLLGLNRHGGMIIWDDDIDIGLLKEDFQRVVSCNSIFAKAGLNLRRNLPDLFKLGVLDVFLLTERSDGFYSGRCATCCEKDEFKTATKQIFANTYVYAPINAEKTLIKRFGEDYFNFGNPSNGFHGDKTMKSFNIAPHDRCYISY